MKILVNILYAIILLVVVFFAGSLFLSRTNAPFAYKVYSVESGSMEPTVHKGAVVVVVAQDNYSEGDIITFRAVNSSDKTVTHRIVGIEKDDDIGKLSYSTQGDANEDPDSNTTDQSKVIGRVITSIPYLGYPISLAKTQTGFILLIIIPATLIVYSEVNNIKNELKKTFDTKKREKNDKKKEEQYDEDEEEK